MKQAPNPQQKAILFMKDESKEKEPPKHPAVIAMFSDLLARTGLNAAGLAEKIGTTPQGISNYMTGRNEPGRKMIAAIIKAFPAINAVWLATGEGDPFPLGIHGEKRPLPTKEPTPETEPDTTPAEEVQSLTPVRRKLSRPMMVAEPNLDHLPAEKQADYWKERYKKEIRRQAEEFEASEHQETLRLISNGPSFNSASSDTADLYAFADSLAFHYPLLSTEALEEVRSLPRFKPAARVIPIRIAAGFKQQAS